jgi:hypothetical protein
MANQTTLTQEEIAEKYGYRSGLEDNISLQLVQRKVNFTYEEVKIKFKQPEKNRTYTPDFILVDSGIIIESKGRFTVEDRMKHELIKKQHPTLDIRFVFTNPKAKISKTSKTTYAKWCEDRGFKYAKGPIPEEWLNE